ncbi:MAG: tRNA epoxyqueuosine(34) reductase QueG [Alphaproteobacteria bacterium]|nr:tRNA epoxyqueuosine(34) reductase QueG [Alphaproteobacteria bacterium]MCB9696551.1 tRNA epoxyqueuosine(34) reductase QueG [Alphaproteobacteria bacterium]
MGAERRLGNDELRELALSVGFHDVRVTRVRTTPRGEALDRWLARGDHADLHWLARGRDVRLDPRVRHAWARTAVVVAVHHHHRVPDDPGGRTGRVARYAWGRDYHNLLGKRLRKLKARLGELGVRSWGGVDTAPIVERSWAEAAGLGAVGKNTTLLVPGRGSFLLLGVLFLDADLEPDPASTRDPCRTCVRCLRACPTDALPEPHRLRTDACISYWTIEARGLPPRALRSNFGRWFFGCDVCQEVCPHAHDPDDPDEDDLLPRHAWVDLDDVVASSDDDLLRRFEGTPLRRPGAAGLKRNALLVLANLGDPGAVPVIRRHALAHPEPVVRAAGVWALRSLGERIALPTETDPLVRGELDAEDAVRAR